MVDFVVLGGVTSIGKEDWGSNAHKGYMLESSLEILIEGLLCTILLDNINY